MNELFMVMDDGDVDLCPNSIIFGDPPKSSLSRGLGEKVRFISGLQSVTFLLVLLLRYRTHYSPHNFLYLYLERRN